MSCMLPPRASRDEIWAWLATAPLPVVLSLCLSTSGMLAGWMWLVAGEVRAQSTTAAVAANQAGAAVATARVAATAQQNVEARLNRLEDKLDRLLDAVADMKIQAQADRRAAASASRKEKTR